jgi:hypothetical protein
VKRTRKTVTSQAKMLCSEKWKLVRNLLMWPGNENYGTNCDNLDMLIKEISETVEEVGLDSVDPMGITEVSPSNCPMKNFMCWPNN